MFLLIQRGLQSKHYIDLMALLYYDLAFSFPWKTFVWPEDSIPGSVFPAVRVCKVIFLILLNTLQKQSGAQVLTGPFAAHMK